MVSAQPRLRPAKEGRSGGSEGLVGGEALSLDELAQFGVFDGTKRAFWMKLARNLGTTTGEAGLGIRSVVRRDYRKGEVICRAGEFGASAFVLVEGSARSFVPGRSTAAAVPGRTESSLRALAELFRRRSRTRVDEPDPAALWTDVLVEQA